LETSSTSPLEFVQQALLSEKEVEYDMKPLATLTTSPMRTSTSPTPTTSLQLLIPQSYQLPDDDLIRSLYPK